MMRCIAAPVPVPEVPPAIRAYEHEDRILDAVSGDVFSQPLYVERLLRLGSLLAIRLNHDLVHFVGSGLGVEVASPGLPATQVVLQPHVLDPSLDVVNKDAALPNGDLHTMVPPHQAP